MSQNYNIIITSGTSPGPYTIYYNLISDSNIATEYGSLTLATGVTLSELTSGYYVTVPDNTTSIIVYNTFCDNFINLPVSDKPQTYDFCFQYGESQIHFSPVDDYNGFASWESDFSTDGFDYKVIWDEDLNLWTISGGSLSCQAYSTSDYPPLNSWFFIGQNCGNLEVYEGACEPIINQINFSLTTVQPTCVCDGTITISPTSGVAPFTASIDGGVTFGGMVYTDLCPGTYEIIVKDFNDNLSETQIVVLSYSTPITYYSLIYNTIVSTTVVSPSLTTKTYTTTFNVIPALPIGVTVTFDISHFNELQSGPNDTCATQTTNSTLLINGMPQAITTSNTTTSDINQTTPGCLSAKIYITGLTETWENITMDSTTTVQLTTTTSVTSNYCPQCAIRISTDTHSANNISIQNCDCCEAQILGYAT